jgi:hypothetical protein
MRATAGCVVVQPGSSGDAGALSVLAVVWRGQMASVTKQRHRQGVGIPVLSNRVEHVRDPIHRIDIGPDLSGGFN